MKFLLVGASGRLGQKIAQNFNEHQIEFENVGREHTASFQNFKALIDKQTTDKNSLLILDVSLPNVTHDIANFLCEMYLQDLKLKPKPTSDNRYPQTETDNGMPKGLIVGTTGHSEECSKTLKELSKIMPVCLVPNFSKGIFLLGELLKAPLANGETLAVFAKKLGFNISLNDIHHQHKRDAPSGTALWLGKAMNMDPKSIASTRTGDVIGEHSIILSSQNEITALSHKVTSRDVFAEGAYELSIRFFEKKLSPGLYSVSDIWMA